LDNTWIAGELSFAAVIKYCRATGSGVRGSVEHLIKRLPPELQAQNEYFTNIRNKFVAHSVNSFEDNQVFANLAPQLDPTYVGSITVDTGRVVSLSPDNISALRLLAEILKQLVQQDIAQETARVLEYARTLPISDLLERDTESRPLTHEENVGKRRRH
jgi:hypothetical protein